MSTLAKTLVLSLIVAAVARILGRAPRPQAAPPLPPLTEAEIDAALAAEADRRGLASLDWRHSIVDLLALLEIRNDFSSRVALWVDLDLAEIYTGSDKQNMLMINEVRQRWAAGLRRAEAASAAQAGER